MKREKLETYIGRQVKVLLFDGRAYEGCLQKTNTDAVKHNPNLYLKHNYYALLDKEHYGTNLPLLPCYEG